MTKVDRDIRISTVGRDDYPELEGKIVLISDKWGSDPVEGIVVGCNRAIGVTVVETSNKDNYLLCFTGPTAPGGIMESMLNDMDEGGKSYDEVFDHAVQIIIDGGWVAGSVAEFVSGGNSLGGSCDGSQCAYHQ